jgi:hypothetical protein
MKTPPVQLEILLMTEIHDRNLTRILSALQKKHEREAEPPPGDQGRVFGIFLDTAREAQGMSRKQLARLIDFDDEVIDILLDGHMPAFLIDDQLIRRAAQALSLNPNILRIMLERSFVPSTVQESQPVHAEAGVSARRQSILSKDD